MAGCIIIIIFNGWQVFLKGQWNVSDFITAYINIPIFAGLYAVYKIVTKSKIIGVADMDFVSNVPPLEMYDREEPTPTTITGKIWAWLF